MLKAAEQSRLHAFIVLCLLTGLRSEEARALTCRRNRGPTGSLMASVLGHCYAISAWAALVGRVPCHMTAKPITPRIPHMAHTALPSTWKSAVPILGPTA